MWHNVPVCCSGFKHLRQIRLGQKFPIFCSDHFWFRKYSFNIHYPFLTREHFIMFFLRKRLMCFLQFLQILRANNLNSYFSKMDGSIARHKIFIIFGFNRSYFFNKWRWYVCLFTNNSKMSFWLWCVKTSRLLPYITITSLVICCYILIILYIPWK